MKIHFAFKILPLLICWLSIVFSYQPANGQLLNAMYEKMRLIREKNSAVLGTDNLVKSDSIAAYNGNESSMIRYGNWCLRNNREKIGIDFLKWASSLNNDTAKCYLAEAYYWGIGVSHDPAKAEEILKTIEIKEGIILKGIMIYDGLIFSKDYQKAAEIFKSVNPESFYYNLSCYYLSKCYRYGRGVKKDINKSIEFIEKAKVRPLKARNIEETKAGQFWEITKPINDEIRKYKELKSIDIHNSAPSFGLG